MGLNTRGTTGSNKTYLNIYSNNIVLEYSNKEDLAKKLDSLGIDYNEDKVSDESKMGLICVRQKTKGRNEGKDVFYYILNDVSGLLTNIRINNTDFGEFVELELTDVDEKFSVSLGDASSRIAKDFVRRMGNIKLNDELVFGVWNITAEEADNGKPKSGVKMYQDDTKLEYFISYEDMPEPETKTRRGKTTWDFSEQEDFLYSALTEYKSENFADGDDSTATAVETKPKAARKPSTRKDNKEVKDDLPF